MSDEIPKPIITESHIYDNCLDIEKRKDEYRTNSPGLEDHISELKESIDVFEKYKISVDNDKTYFKVLKFSTRNEKDYLDFLEVFWINFQKKENSTNKWFYYKELPKSSLGFSQPDPSIKSTKHIKSEKFTSSGRSKVWKRHWKEMPEYVNEDNLPYNTVDIFFKTKEDFDHFCEKIKNCGVNVNDKTITFWYPKLEITKNSKLRWIIDEQQNLNVEDYNPKYPVYIVSKGRHESMITSKSLNRMKIHHYIAIEPQDYDNYVEALKNFNLEYAELLVLPFSNHGDGPGRARNWCWDHSIYLGAKRHWVLDDNISDFYRLHNNVRVRVENGVCFRACEDFVDRFTNVPVSGLQYRFFIAPNSYYPAYVKNTRIYSCLLIENTCKHRWRGRYNEDTDLSLRVLKDGDCTIQFNIFLQGKAATQTVKGGNTQEFYHVEGNLDKTKWRDGQLNTQGTIKKSKMLEDMHPDVARVVWKYGRWHHFVDYNPFKSNKLQYVKDVKENLKNENNNYGLKFIDNYGEK